MDRLVDISAEGHKQDPSVSVSRRSGVPDVFWSQLLSEWGIRGDAPGQGVTVPIERFLSRLGWLAPACRQHSVGLGWNADARALVERSRQDLERLRSALSAPPFPDPNAVTARLAATRFVRQLRKFQSRDLGRLLSMANGANYSVPGAGKTTVTLALYELERTAGRVERLLVVAPLSAYEAWTEEVGCCFRTPPTVVVHDGGEIPVGTEILLTNYHRLASSYEDVARWVWAKPCHVVLDEAHRMKRGWAGEWGRSSLNLAYLAERRDVLTGTPAPQSMRDLEALMDFTWRGHARTLVPLQRVVEPADPASQSVAAMRPLFVRTKKSDLGLPPKAVQIVRIPLEGLQRDIYTALKNQYAGDFALSRRSKTELARMGEVAMYLLEAATNPQLLPAGASQFDDVELRHPPIQIPDGSPLVDLIRSYSRYEFPPKLTALARLVKENADGGRKTLIWTNFVRNNQMIEQLLAPYNPAVIHGAVPVRANNPSAPRTREGELHRFRTDGACMALIANPAATSEGVSLHQICRDAIYVERTFNAGQYLQSVDRIHRLGMDMAANVKITLLITAGTIDEVVNIRIQEKTQRLGALLDDADLSALALPDEEEGAPPLEAGEDIEALLAHLRSNGDR